MLILIEGPKTNSSERQHLKTLQNLMKQTKGTMRVASPYVTDTQLMSGMKDRERRLLTRASRMDFISRASSLESLITLIKAGVECRCVSNEHQLHAKVYLFDDQSAVVTSANLTQKALDQNIEVGIHVSGATVGQLINWFDGLWYDHSAPLDLAKAFELQKEIKADREEYSARWKDAEKQPLIPVTTGAALSDLFDTAGQFFVCNTNRRDSDKWERTMHKRGYAAAWEPFRYPSHIGRVREGDAIFMFANGGAGIIGVGQAKGPCETLGPKSRDRLIMTNTDERRVPVTWLVWNNSDGYPSNGQRPTFLDVSGDKYLGLRNGLKKHFLGLTLGA